MANNVDIDSFVGGKIIDGKIVIVADAYDEPQKSNSGKTKLLFSSGGFQGFLDAKEYPMAKWSLNVTVPNGK